MCYSTLCGGRYRAIFSPTELSLTFELIYCTQQVRYNKLIPLQENNPKEAPHFITSKV